MLHREKEKRRRRVENTIRKENVQLTKYSLNQKEAAMAHMCVCCHPIYSGRQGWGRTSRGHTGGRSPPSFCGACLSFYREKDSAVLFPRRPCSRVLCTHKLIVLHLLGIIIIIFIFVRKNPSSCDFTEIPTHVPTSECFEVIN